MAQLAFINMAVADVAAATRFYEAVGATKNPKFSNEQCSSMAWSDNLVMMLQVKEFFQTFTKRPVGDPRVAPVALICLSRDSRTAVDSTVAAAIGAGGRALEEPQDHGFMYGQSVEDPDGHILEFMWMDPRMAEMGPEALAAEAAG